MGFILLVFNQFLGVFPARTAIKNTREVRQRERIVKKLALKIREKTKKISVIISKTSASLGLCIFCRKYIKKIMEVEAVTTRGIFTSKSR